jgi:hypothetical protein
MRGENTNLVLRMCLAPTLGLWPRRRGLPTERGRGCRRRGSGGDGGGGGGGVENTKKFDILVELSLELNYDFYIAYLGRRGWKWQGYCRGYSL